MCRDGFLLFLFRFKAAAVYFKMATIVAVSSLTVLIQLYERNDGLNQNIKPYKVKEL